MCGPRSMPHPSFSQDVHDTVAPMLQQKHRRSVRLTGSPKDTRVAREEEETETISRRRVKGTYIEAVMPKSTKSPKPNKETGSHM